MSLFIGKSLLLCLLVFFSGTNSVASQASCTATSDCDIPLTGTVTCQAGECFTCPYYETGGVEFNQTRRMDRCHPICVGPSTIQNNACGIVLDVSNGQCFAMNDPSVSGYTTDEPTLMTPTGTVYYVTGVCASCASGYVVNDKFTTCVPESGPLSPPPTFSPPLRGEPPPSPPPAPVSPPPTPTPPTGGTPPAPNPSTGTPGITLGVKAEKEVVPKWVVGLAVSGAGAVLAGIIGIIFYCCQNRHAYAIARQRHPLADAMREQMKLKQVDNFDANPGLQFRSSVQMLAEALAARQVVRPHTLLGHATSALASVMSEVLKERYPLSTTINEKGLLALFAKDCIDDQAKDNIASAIELKIGSSAAWSEQLLMPPSTAAAPQAPPVASIPAHMAKPTAPRWD